MKEHLRPALTMLLALTLLTGVMYPLIITGLAQIIFPQQANGSLIVRDGKVIGSHARSSCKPPDTDIRTDETLIDLYPERPDQIGPGADNALTCGAVFPAGTLLEGLEVPRPLRQVEVARYYTVRFAAG